MPIFVTDSSISDIGGIQRYVARVATILAARGVDVVVIEPETAHRKTWPGIRMSRYRRTGRVGSLIALFWAIASEIRTNPKEILIASVWYPNAFLTALIPRRLRGPLVVLAHGRELFPNRRDFRKWAMRWTCARADLIIVNSHFTRTLLTDAGVRARAVVVACGVDAKPERRDPALDPTILSVGRLIARKGFDRTIEAMPIILAACPSARYRIVGDGPQKAELQQLAFRLGVSSSVDFLGALDDEATDLEYRRAWCFAMPCRRIADDVEGFGIVYLEAAMAGVPTVGGRGSGAADAIADGETGRLVDGNDPGAIAEAILAYLRDRLQSELAGRRGRERAESFTWERTAEAIAQQLDLVGT